MKKLILILLFLLPQSSLFLQEIPECMCVPLTYPPTGERTNQDSACIVDTCNIWYPSKICDEAYWNNVLSIYGEETKKRVYSKGHWSIKFEVPAIPIPATDIDTIIYVDWSAIDTNYSEIRAAFQLINDSLGGLYFRKLSPTADENAKRFFLYFYSYVNVDFITQKIRQLNGVFGCDFANWPYKSPSTQVILSANNDRLFISPNPATEYIEIRNLTPRPNPKEKGVRIEVFDVLGRRHSFNHPSLTLPAGEEGTVRLDVSHLQPGIYFVRVGDEFLKFVKM